MKLLLAVSSFLATVLIASAQTCGENAERIECGSSCRPYCNWDESEHVCITVCENNCYCLDGYIRAAVDSEDCIPESECVTCEQTKEYLTCGTACPDYCNKPEGGECTTQCVQGCFCKEGYVLEIEGGTTCILESSCPAPARVRPFRRG